MALPKLNPLQRITNFSIGATGLTKMSRITGIPKTTLWNVSKGRRQMPAKYNRDLKLFYNRETYRALRNVGMSVNQSKRFRASNVGDIIGLTQRMGSLVDQLAWGQTTLSVQRHIKQGKLYVVNDLFNQARQAVIKGISSSPLTIEDWENYIAQV